MEQNISFPQRLQALREKRRLSRRTLAELCGLSKNMISLYERGDKAHLSRRLSIWRIFLVCPQTICLEEKIFRVPTHGGHGLRKLCYSFIGQAAQRFYLLS